jgi:hypothetical protein
MLCLHKFLGKHEVPMPVDGDEEDDMAPLPVVCVFLLQAVGLEQDPSEALAHRVICSHTTASDADYSEHGWGEGLHHGSEGHSNCSVHQYTEL